MLAYAEVLHLPRWCRQNSHMTCSKIRWRSTAIFFCLSRYVLIIIHIEKIWSLVKGIESTCILSFFFLFLAFGLCYFHKSNNNRLIYYGVLQSAQFCLIKMAVLAYSAYSEIAKSRTPLYLLNTLRNL